jgi:REP element-mobilizing transposase RayT
VYFVTVCSHRRECLFGEIVGGEMVGNSFGEVAVACWHAIPEHFANVTLDAFVLMPNHLHGIVIIQNDVVGARHASPLPSYAPQEPSPPTGVPPRSLGAIIASFKAATTRQINQTRETPAPPVWQRNYHERILRNERVLDATRHYIANNPRHWTLDDENPANHPPAPSP